MDRWDIAKRIAEAAILVGIDLNVNPDDADCAFAAHGTQTVHSAFGTALDREMLRCSALDLAPMPARFPSAAALVDYWRVSAEDRYRAIWGHDYEGSDAIGSLAEGSARYARTLTDTVS